MHVRAKRKQIFYIWQVHSSLGESWTGNYKTLENVYH